MTLPASIDNGQDPRDKAVVEPGQQASIGHACVPLKDVFSGNEIEVTILRFGHYPIDVVGMCPTKSSVAYLNEIVNGYYTVL